MKRRDFITGLGLSALWLKLARAQQAGCIPLVAILWHAGSPEEEGVLYDAMHTGFAALGYLAGKNIMFEERFPGETPGQFERFANELVALKPDVLVAVATPSILSAQKATTTIPIVFLPPLDPIRLKLVKSLAHPDGNLTGLTTIAEGVPRKRVQLLKSTFPSLASSAIMFDPVVAYKWFQRCPRPGSQRRNWGCVRNEATGRHRSGIFNDYPASVWGSYCCSRANVFHPTTTHGAVCIREQTDFDGCI